MNFFTNLDFLTEKTELLHLKMMELVCDFNDKVCQICDERTYSKTMLVFLMYFLQYEFKEYNKDIYEMTNEERVEQLKIVYDKSFDMINFVYQNNISPAEILRLDDFQ
jgi:hypothetical protein